MVEIIPIKDAKVVAAREDFLQMILKENSVPYMMVQPKPIDPGKRPERWDYFDVLDELEREIVTAIAELEAKLVIVRS